MSNQPTNTVTGQVRLSYVHTQTPYANKPGQEPKYSVTILIPKSDQQTMQSIQACINAASQRGLNSIWNGVRPAQMIGPVWDGDGPRKNGEPFSAECRGHWVVTASSKTKQQIVDANMLPILDATEVYSGMYARVAINFFPYFNSGNKGVGCGLGPIQKLADGEPLGNQMTAESAFGGGAGGYTPPVQQYQQPVQQYAPQPNYQQPGQPAYPQQTGQPAYPQQPAQPTYPQPQYGQQPQQQYAPPVPTVQPQYPAQQYAPQTQPQPQYPQPPQQYAPQAPPLSQYLPQVQYDPITGRTIPAGGVMGL